MKHLILSLLTVIFFCSGCLKESEDILNPDDDQKITVLVFNNQPILYNPEENRHELLLGEAQLTAEILSEAEVNISLGEVESNSWTAIPGDFSPNLAAIETVYFDFLLSIGQIIIFSEELPEFEEVDVQIVIKEDE